MKIKFVMNRSELSGVYDFPDEDEKDPQKIAELAFYFMYPRLYSIGVACRYDLAKNEGWFIAGWHFIGRFSIVKEGT